MTEQLSLLEDKPKKKVTAKKVVEVSIPQKFDFIEWADKLKPLVKDKSIEVIFKERPRELWGSDPLIPQTKEHFEEMLHYLSKYDDITCDVETNGLSFVDPNVRICGHVFTAGEKSFYLPIRHITNEWQLEPEFVKPYLQEVIYQRKDAVLNFHNAMFDYNQLLKDGIDLTWRFKEHSIVDTQIMYWLLDENQIDDPYYYILRPGYPAERTRYRSGLKGHANKAKELGAVQLQGYSLKVLAPKLIGTPMTKFDDLMEHIGFDKLPIHFGGAYARVDGIATKALKDRYYPEIKKQKLETAFHKVEMKFVRVRADMQRRGMGVDLDALTMLEQRAIKEQQELLEKLYKEVGPIKFSNKQLSELFHGKLGLPVLAKTKSGNPAFDESAMDLYEKYLNEHADKYGKMAEIPKIIIRIKKLEKIIGTYIKGIWENIDVDARVHTNLHQTSTVTGRLSSSEPNLQNLTKAPVFVDELDREEWIEKRKTLGDLNINKMMPFSVFYLDEDGEALGMEDGWEEKCQRVVMKWLFRDVFSERGFTPENRERFKHKYPRFGEVDAYVKDGKLVTIDLCQDDWLYLVSDYSQMELRMMAHLADAKGFIGAFKNGLDPHKKTAADVFGVEFDHVTKDQRGKAKAVNFGVIYGKTAYGFAVDWYSKEPDFWVKSSWNPTGLEPAEKYLKMAQEFIDKYFEGMPEVKKYIESRQMAVMKNGYVRTITGRKRRLPEVFSENTSIRNRAKRQAINTIDQGSSADYLKISMNAVEDWSDDHTEDLPLFQIMTVHDEVIFLCLRRHIEALEPIIIDKMTNTIKLRCPIETEPHAAYTYGSAK